MANPHCWFRRPADEADRYADDLGAQSRGYASRDHAAMGIPMPQAAHRGNNQEQEEEDYHLALVRLRMQLTYREAWKKSRSREQGKTNVGSSS